jgi:hypothetical protein
MQGNDRNDPALQELKQMVSALAHRVEDLAREGKVKQRSVAVAHKRRGSVVPDTDGDEQARAEPDPGPPEPPDPRNRKLPMETRIRAMLETAFLDTRGVAKGLGESEEVVARELQELQRDQKITNVGSEDYQSWFWRPGSSITHQELMVAIVRLISHQPLPVKVIQRATGATDKQVDNALVDIRRAHAVWDVSTGGRAKCYFIMPPHAKDARLTGRREKKPRDQ